MEEFDKLIKEIIDIKNIALNAVKEKKELTEIALKYIERLCTQCNLKNICNGYQSKYFCEKLKDRQRIKELDYD